MTRFHCPCCRASRAPEVLRRWKPVVRRASAVAGISQMVGYLSRCGAGKQ